MSVSGAALGLGYVLAVPFTLFLPGFLRLWRRREPWVFATAQVGALLIVIGWAQKGATASALLNAAWLVGLSVAYVREGRVRARAGGPRPS
ncbi:MAG: hypothetical protein Q8R60_01385 [Mycobacteriales bacterium]|nr:hypothetical protein [Mycobacteriales bacterium]